MLFFVWSLVSSAIEASRKKYITNFLRVLLEEQKTIKKHEILVWNINGRSSDRNDTERSRLYRPISEPKLNRYLVLQTERLQVFSEPFEALLSSEWKFCPSFYPCEIDSIYFMIHNELVLDYATNSDEAEEKTIFRVDEKCERIASHKTKLQVLYSCGLETFVDVVYAFSEAALMDGRFRVAKICSLFAPLDNVDTNKLNITNFKSSTLSLESTSSQRPLPILQQLFWGDQVMELNGNKCGSESSLAADLLSPVRRSRPMSASTRRRYPSYNSYNAEESIAPSYNYISGCDDFRSLPRYIRHLNQRSQQQLKCIENEKNSDNDISDTSTVAIASSESFNSSKDISNQEIDKNSARSHFTLDELRMIDETDVETIDSNCLEKPVDECEKISYAVLATRNTNNDRNIPTIVAHEDNKLEDDLNFSKTKIGDGVPEKPPICQSNGKSKRSISVVARNCTKTQVRRFSAFDTNVERGRSISPSFEHYQHRSLRGFTTPANRNRCSSRSSGSRGNQSFTDFTSSRASSFKVMTKPKSILVYTGDNETLYQEIRDRLATLLPPDELTVFNISIEAIRKQPWIEQSTVCVILASTNNLDDEAWSKIQTYFNQNGKIIFVCQNKLLASVTNSTSKDQASILRFAFNKGNQLDEKNKEFSKFLKKNLKILPKSGKINETYRSKDLNSPSSFSVVLKKEPNSPLFLYMQNNGAQHASVLFSDATTQELLSPHSNLLRDSLQSVGVKVDQVEIPRLTRAFMIAEYDSIIEGLSGLRLGEKIGAKPEIILRKTEIVKGNGLPDPTENLLPVEVIANESSTTEIRDFDMNEYFDQLTSRMGQIVVHTDVATTTMDICGSLNNAIPSLDNIVVIANRQLKGRGRGGNEFLSPKGSALFNFSFIVKKSSRFAQNIPILQHVFCVALVEAARLLSGYPDLPLRIKWPNDIYHDRLHKVGGMLITCKPRDDAFLITIGCGINVSNEKPTICLNDILPNDAERRITSERLIAETLNRYQYWINDYEQNGPDGFKKKYYEYWLHSQQEVLLSDLNERVVIRGIDEYGYLQVRSRSNPDKIFSIGDDGNTFDMMKGLIRHKY